MIQSDNSVYRHPRVDQGVHGRLGGMKGNCFKAKRGGHKGARKGKLGGQASKGKTKSKTNFVQNLFLVSQFRTYYDLRKLVNRSFSVLDDDDGLNEDAVLVLRQYIFGEFHNFEKARMREVVHW